MSPSNSTAVHFCIILHHAEICVRNLLMSHSVILHGAVLIYMCRESFDVARCCVQVGICVRVCYLNVTQCNIARCCVDLYVSGVF